MRVYTVTVVEGKSFKCTVKPPNNDHLSTMTTLNPAQAILALYLPLNNDHLSTTTTLNPGQAILALYLPLNNDHLSTATSGRLNLVKNE